ncbi:MAG: deoxyguanosinetriphosphate triphosphohydrolase [Actinobacteria bacterium]|nr:MAG: deoxyguanosinetriphosphate triphosphohydrolase [Actinomycetota bacterium]
MIENGGPPIPHGYRPADLERRAPEPTKDPQRPAFVRDRARVLHSWALRRLADKTQVLMPGVSDFPRTRLTHTLEVAQIAREMGADLGADPDLVDAAALCHDLGHPPFGHNGEDALDAVAAAVGGFEGNAQSFRLLTRLEPKVLVDGRSFGLNLSRAVLDATVKYPWARPREGGKYNVYPDDLPAFEWVRAGAPLARRCVEAQVMDWSDDVAYSVHDIEDALYSGFISGEVFGSGDGSDAVIESMLQEDPAWGEDELRAARGRLAAAVAWPTHEVGSVAFLAAVKAVTSTLIARFTAAAVVATLDRHGTDRITRYDADVEVPVWARAEVAYLKAVASEFVFKRPGAEALYADQRVLLVELVDAVLAGGRAVLHPWLADDWEAATAGDARLRVAVDQVASLTDVSAVRWHERLCRPGGA